MLRIGWEPKRPRKRTLVEGTEEHSGSSLGDSLVKAFGQGFPMTLGKEDEGILQGIAACGYPGADELREAVLEHYEIIVSLE